MAKHCVSPWHPGHFSTSSTCDYCDQRAIWHWKATYPDVLLCFDCLELYPEAWLYPCFDLVRHNITTLSRVANRPQAVTTVVGRAKA